MRNLKRVLSLGMTAAMITGLMVVGTSAAHRSDGRGHQRCFLCGCFHRG